MQNQKERTVIDLDLDHLRLFIYNISICQIISLSHEHIPVLKLPGSRSWLLVFPCYTDALEMSHVLFQIKIYHRHSTLGLYATTLLEHYFIANYTARNSAGQVRGQCNFLVQGGLFIFVGVIIIRLIEFDTDFKTDSNFIKYLPQNTISQVLCDSGNLFKWRRKSNLGVMWAL